jgi:protein O-mannosyl-transferase
MANPISRLLLLRAMLIGVAGFWVFAPALRGDWLMDDDMYLANNVLLHDPARLWKIWFAPGSLIEYYPIEASVQAVQWHLWHLDTLGYRLTNVLLHIVSALLIWRLLGKFEMRYAWLGGLLFAIHPVVIESVAWISELKNTLSLPPFLLAMCAWLDYEDRGRPRDYALALVLFLIAMLCKISMALFPLVILLYAWWKRNRIGLGDLKAAALFFAISLVLGLTTIWAGNFFRVSHLQSSQNPDIGGFAVRLALAGESILFYFFKCLWPVEMIPIYPQWRVDPHAFISFLPWLILVAAISSLWYARATWGRHALLGLGFFLINLLPFVGFNSITYMAFTWVMDHFVYIPLIGLIGLAVAALEQIDDHISAPARTWLAGGIAVTLALLAGQSHAYAGNFASPEKLWTYTVAHNPTSSLAYNNLGNVLLETDRKQEAIEAYENALRINPRSVEANNNLGFARFKQGQTLAAIDLYEQALKSNPHFALGHLNMARALFTLGRIQEAIDHYRLALLINPADGETRANLAKLQALQKRNGTE